MRQQNQSERSLLSGAENVSGVLQLVVAIVGAIAALVGRAREGGVWIVAAGGITILVSIVWFGVSRFRRRRRRGTLAITEVPRGSGAYLRGLLPFETGETLLGRSRDKAAVLTKIRSSECRFGYISGDAGVGKTSLLRSGIIPEMSESGFEPVYIPKPGPDPLAAARKALKTKWPEHDFSAGTTLTALLTHTSAVVDKPLLLIWDQFEEFFVARPAAKERRELFEQIGRVYLDGNLDVRLIVSLRKEFVDDLQELSEWIPQPLDSRFSYRLRNWDYDDAAEVLRSAAMHDQVPFADALQEQLLTDLEQGGEIRPVELQLVASRLADDKIYLISDYRAAKGAQGILSSYIQEVIQSTPPTPDAEVYQTVTRTLLRLLCAEATDTKRPIGLTFEELLERIAASVPRVVDASDLRAVVAECLQRCVSAYIVIREDEERFNLRHDYVARPILNATAGVSTIEQEANRVLDRHLEQARSGRPPAIGRRELKLISRYATPERIAAPLARSMIRRNRRRHLVQTALVALLVLLLITAIFPPRLVTEPVKFDVPHDHWILSANHRTAVSFSAEGESKVWRVSAPWPGGAKPIGIKMRSVWVGRSGRYVGGITASGDIYVWPADKPLAKNAEPALRISVPSDKEFFKGYFWRICCGFNPDETLAYAHGSDGKFYLWRIGEVLSRNASPLAEFNNSDDGKYERPVAVVFSPASEFVAIGDPKGTVWLHRLRGTPAGSIQLPHLEVGSFSDTGAIEFSKSGRWIVYQGRDQRLEAADLSRFPNPIQTHARFDVHNEISDDVTFAIAPDEGHVIFRPSFRRFSTWQIDRSSSQTLPPSLAGNDSDRSSDSSPGITFSRDGKWVAGQEENAALYVWPVAMTPNSVVKPAIPPGRATGIIAFNPPGTSLAAVAANGETYVFRPGTMPDLKRPVVTLASDHREIMWATDGQNLYAHSGPDVYFGDSTEKLDLALRAESPVNGCAVSDDLQDLVVFSDHHLTMVKRRIVMWYLVPLKTLTWPAIAYDAAAN